MTRPRKQEEVSTRREWVFQERHIKRKTLEEIGSALGITKERVRQLYFRACDLRGIPPEERLGHTKTGMAHGPTRRARNEQVRLMQEAVNAGATYTKAAELAGWTRKQMPPEVRYPTQRPHRSGPPSRTVRAILVLRQQGASWAECERRLGIKNAYSTAKWARDHGRLTTEQKAVIFNPALDGRRQNHGRPKGKRKTHCLRGHLLAPENVYVSKEGARNCRECLRRRAREGRLRARAAKG